jgi:hypothetical protein
VVIGAVDPSALRLGFQRSASVPSRSVMREEWSAFSLQPSAISYLPSAVSRQPTAPHALPSAAVRQGVGEPGASCENGYRHLHFAAEPGPIFAGPVAGHLPGSRVEHVFASGDARATRPRGQPRPARTMRRRGIVGSDGATKPGSEERLLVGGGRWRGMANSAVQHASTPGR